MGENGHNKLTKSEYAASKLVASDVSDGIRIEYVPVHGFVRNDVARSQEFLAAVVLPVFVGHVAKAHVA